MRMGIKESGTGTGTRLSFFILVHPLCLQKKETHRR